MLARRGDRTVEDRGRRLAADAVTMVRPVEVVELHEVTEAAIERGAAGEVVTPEHDAPVLGEDGLLQALDEAVGPSVTRPNPGVADSEGHAGGIELGFKLTAAIGQHAPHRPAGSADSRDQDVAEKLRDGARRQLGQDSGHAVGARRIASGDLPHFADALELADVERVETEQGPPGEPPRRGDYGRGAAARASAACAPSAAPPAWRCGARGPAAAAAGWRDHGDATAAAACWAPRAGATAVEHRPPVAPLPTSLRRSRRPGIGARSRAATGAPDPAGLSSGAGADRPRHSGSADAPSDKTACARSLPHDTPH